MSAAPGSIRGERMLAVVALVAIAAAILVPALDLAAPGRILHWHVTQPAYVHGAIEALALYAIVLVAAALRTRAAGAVLAAVGVTLYLRRHHVDVPALVALGFLEAALAAGAIALRRFGADPRDAREPALRFVAGLVLAALLLLASSLAGFGRPRDLALVALPAAIAALAFARVRPASLEILHAALALPPRVRAFALALAVGVVVMLARTNLTVGYDPLWYGFRPEFVLAPERSLFDVTGLVAPVFYFPKLYELLLMPLSSIDDYSFVLAVGVWMLAFGAAYAAVFARRLGASPDLSVGIAGLVGTLPAIANTALSPKPDVLAGLLVLLSAAAAHRALDERRWGPMLHAIAASLLAVQAKLVAIPYAGALALGVAAAAWLEHRAAARVGEPASWRRPDAASIAVLAGAVVVSTVLVARTIVLAGVPTVGPDVLMPIWHALGYSLTDPVGTLDWTRAQDWGDVPALVRDLLLLPSRLEHIVVGWIGNAWLWLAGLAAAATLLHRTRVRPDARSMALCAPVVVAGMVLALGVAYHYRGGDGNYLIAPLALGAIATAAWASRALDGAPRLERAAYAGLVASSVFQFLYGFANAAWAWPGTRTLDLDFSRSVMDTRHARRDALVESGLAELEAWLRTLPRPPRVVGYAEPEHHAYWLSARYEALGNVHFMRPDLVYDAAGFLRLLELSRIEIVVLPDRFDERLHARAVFDVAAGLAARGEATTRRFGDYTAYFMQSAR